MKPKDLIFKTILLQRNTLYQLNRENGITRVDLEVLTFFTIKRFVSVYDLRAFYLHTNVQVIKRSLKKLNRLGLLEIFRQGFGNRPTYYCITRTGKVASEKYCETLLNDQSLELEFAS